MKSVLGRAVRAIRLLLAKIKAIVVAPPCLVRLRRMEQLSSIEEVVDFCFDSCFGIIRPMQVRRELSALLRQVREQRPSTMLEIGTARGGTLFCFAQVMPGDACLMSVDLPSGRFGGGYPAWKRSLYHSFSREEQVLHLIRADSHESATLKTVEHILDGASLDFLFIDGDHTYEGVKSDFEQYSPLVRDGGLIALHDIVPHRPQSGCEVDRFWRELEAVHDTRRIVEEWEQEWAGIGVVYV